jgi:phage terminase large subunit-like protein
MRNYAAITLKYVEDVVAKRIPASKWIRLACQRHLDDLAKIDSRWKFDSSRVHRVCAFAEQMRHEKGRLQGQRFVLQPFQVWLLSSIFGWVDSTGIRKYREVLIMLPRGSGKSPLAAIIALWMAFLDGEPGSEVLTAATTEKQAREVFSPAQFYVQEIPAFAKIGIIAAAKSIYQPRTRSKFYPVIGRAKYGSAPYCAILDEAHQLPDDQQYSNFKTGLAKRKNSLLLIISTAGVSSTENPCLALQQDAEKVLQGLLPNDRLFAAIYTADPDVDWTSREAILMASPNIGVSIDEEQLLLDQAEAKRNPARQNAFRAMALNQWMTSSASWMNMSAWAKCFDPDLTQELVSHLPCWPGSDLASKLDLAAMVRLYRDDSQGAKPHFYAFTRCYLPEDRVNDPANGHYLKWSIEGHLTATPGSSIDYTTIEADALEDIAANNVTELPYDARYADQWSQRVEELSGVTRVEVPPSPAVLSPAMKELEAAIYDGRFHHDGNPVLTWCMSNLLTRETGAGNYTIPSKQKPESKIDAAIALIIAMSRARLFNPEQTADYGFVLI